MCAMPEINWAELDEGRYEKMIAVLLNTIHPGSERIDGRGGDRGRDVQLRSAEGVRLFQQRYVLGRVDSSRRRHIKESLAEAAKHNPLDWSLVIPIDHTEGELKWFDKLRSQYPFPLHWCGLTWLNQQMVCGSKITSGVVAGR